MALHEITLNGEQVLVEVVDLPVEGGGAGGWEYTANPGDETPPGDLAQRVRGLLGALTSPVHEALRAAAADEWSVQITVGFKAGSGVPFLAAGEANAAVKVTAKWKRGD